MTITNLRTEAEAVAAVVCADGVNQSLGFWQPDGACCVGARIAHALGIPSGDFRSGADAFAARIGATRAHLALMLRFAGAAHDPFSTEEWPLPVSTVWQRLAAIETLPSLIGADLTGLNLAHADLAGAHLAGADLTGADLVSANLADANLRGVRLDNADLTDANLTGTDLTGAQLAGANLSCSVLDDANFSDAHMPRAILDGADASRVDFSGADLAGASLRAARLRASNLTNTRLDHANSDYADFMDAIMDAAESQARTTPTHLLMQEPTGWKRLVLSHVADIDDDGLAS